MRAEWWSQLQVPPVTPPIWPLANEDLAVFTLDRPPWVLKHPYCHQMITQTHLRGNRRVSERVEM